MSSRRDRRIGSASVSVSELYCRAGKVPGVCQRYSRSRDGTTARDVALMRAANVEAIERRAVLAENGRRARTGGVEGLRADRADVRGVRRHVVRDRQIVREQAAINAGVEVSRGVVMAGATDACDACGSAAARRAASVWLMTGATMASHMAAKRLRALRVMVRGCLPERRRIARDCRQCIRGLQSRAAYDGIHAWCAGFVTFPPSRKFADIARRIS